jgi:hypothetical protein
MKVLAIIATRRKNGNISKITSKVISKIIFIDSRFLNEKNKQEKYLHKAFVIRKKI